MQCPPPPELCIVLLKLGIDSIETVSLIKMNLSNIKLKHRLKNTQFWNGIKQQKCSLTHGTLGQLLQYVKYYIVLTMNILL